MPRVSSRQFLHTLVLEVRGGRQCVQPRDRLADAADEGEIERSALDRGQRHAAANRDFFVGQCSVTGDHAGRSPMIGKDHFDRHVSVDPLRSM